MAPPFFVILILASFLGFLNGELRVDFYSSTCPKAEEIVSSVVREAVLVDNNMAAILLRLHFHDCFVQGCDGSILIEGPNTERHAFGHQGVGGFEVIERAKSQLERVCPGVVSCADIVAIAARDAIKLSNGPIYQVPTGRRDGRVSDVSLAAGMPEVNESIQQLKAKFLQKGLSEKDLVLLSAAHTIGTTACFFLTDRLYNFFPGGGSDPSINPAFLPELKAKCPKNGDVNIRLPIDHGSPLAFDSQILRNIRGGFAVLQSDAKLYDDEVTKRVIDSYFGFMSPIFGPSFESDFANSIVKMGKIGVNTGFQGEIRRICKAFN
ncbi:Plant peroxidase [Macleaya cordata]|uniref:Peroxidase n=1 Tax=Macleaya cordata TaxID=56857 RepID=A0A200R8L6_MACCD|nr:Plant peroxidase [Macleaya cordata]